MPARILLTGGTGFLGSHLAARLLAEGHEVTLLARGDRGVSADERARRIMDWHAVGAEARRRLRVVEGDLVAEGLGMGAAERARLSAEVEEIVHCASETSFAERKRDLLEQVNLAGLSRVLDLAADAPRLTAFHHVSTAYAVGRREGICREEWPDPAARFHNPYEETKSRGELMVRTRCAARGVRAVVYRPSIVVGDSRTGRSLLFKALYHPVKAAVLLRDVYLDELRARGGAKAREAGVRLAPDGTLRMPLRVLADGAGIDLLPVDIFTGAFAAIRASPASAGIFHLVAGQPTSLADLVAFASRMFGLSGLRTATAAELADTPPNALEAAFDRIVEVYRPYMSDRRTFATDRAAPLIARAGLRCPAFGYQLFERCMSYAVAVDWGAPPELAGRSRAAPAG